MTKTGIFLFSAVVTGILVSCLLKRRKEALIQKPRNYPIVRRIGDGFSITFPDNGYQIWNSGDIKYRKLSLKDFEDLT